MPKLKVMIVDDDELSLEMMETLLEFNDFEPTKVKNPKEAIELLRIHKHDVLLSDYMMPGMNGLSLIKKIREFDNDVIILFTTAYVKDIIEEQMDAYRVKKLFIKPINVDELLKYLDELYKEISIGIK
jgi:CheY-like chemotaxis protein